MEIENWLGSDVERVAQLSAHGAYDYIIVGSGIGGGVLAEELAKRKKQVLLIERGGVQFTTHVDNTARPDYRRGKADSVEGNELIYDTLKARVNTAENSDEYVGGPLYCLGGRSNVWGLWTPRVDTQTLHEYFPGPVAKYLEEVGNDKAFNLLSNYSQTDAIYPSKEFGPPDGVQVLEAQIQMLRTAIEDYITPDRPLGLGPLGIEFMSHLPYRYPQGAYSSTTALLNRMYARDQYLTVLLEQEVFEVGYTDTSGATSTVDSLLVRSVRNQQVNRISTGGAKVVLSAGTLGSARIALASGLQKRNPLVGKGLIDHQAWTMRTAQLCSKTQGTNPATKQPMLLQSMVNIRGHRALCTTTYNSNFFLGGSSRQSTRQYWTAEGDKEIPVHEARRRNRDEACDTVAVFIEFLAELADTNEVLNTPSSDPVIYLKRDQPHVDEKLEIAMQDLCTKIRNAMLNLDMSDEAAACRTPAPRPTLLGAGVYAHEVGTMRMDAPATKSASGGQNSSSGSGASQLKRGVVDTDLKVHGFDNLYVSDLSVMPVSIPSNPTRTLTGIVLRLAEHLEPGAPHGVDPSG